MSPPILWFVEHVARELHAACAVRAILEREHGIGVAVLPYHRKLTGPEAAALAPKVVVVPYCYQAGDYGLVDHLPLWREAIWFNLSWEQLYYRAHLEAKRPQDAFARRHVIHHAWGPFFRRYLEESGVPAEHVFVNGHPACQLYEEPYRRVFLRRELLAGRHGLDGGRRWVFFPENYGWGFFSDLQLELKVRAGVPRADAVQMRAFCRDSLRTVLDWLRELAREGTVEVILRPRPATTLADFREAVRRALGPLPPRLHLIKEASVREWILASDVVASSFSTSLIEAAVAGKPAYMAEPLPIPPPFDADWYRHAPRLRAREPFLAACLRSAGAPGSTLGTWARDELLGRGDPIRGLADRLVTLCRPGALRPPPAGPELTAARLAAMPTLGQRLRRWASSPGTALRRLRETPRTGSGENDSFTPADVAGLTGEFARILYPGAGDAPA